MGGASRVTKFCSNHENFTTKINNFANLECFAKFLCHENLELYGIFLALYSALHLTVHPKPHTRVTTPRRTFMGKSFMIPYFQINCSNVFTNTPQNRRVCCGRGREWVELKSTELMVTRVMNTSQKIVMIK